MQKMLARITAAIVADDEATVRKLLGASPSLVYWPIRKAKLYRSGIFHWIYAGDTLLHVAAAGHRAEITSLLASYTGWLNPLNRRKAIPLHYAADGFITGPAWDPKRQVETIRQLIFRGALLDWQDSNGATPLHRAVRTRSAAAVNCLLDAGADPSVKNPSGSTPFHLAVQNTGRGGSGEEAAIEAQREIIQTFLARGIDPNRKSRGGKSVAECARSEWIRELLAARPRKKARATGRAKR